MPRPAFTLRVVRTQQEHAIIVDDSDANAIEPPSAAQKISAECRVLSEENDRREFDAKRMKNDLVFIGDKRATHRAEALSTSRFHVQPKLFSISALKNTMCGTG